MLDTKNSHLKRRFLSASMLSGMAAFSALPAQAQDSDADDTIVVTGTRIQRADLNAPSPVTTVSSEQLLLTNTVNTEQFLGTLPQAIPAFDRTSNNPGNGAATVALRGLGTNRTLVLVDGARFVPFGVGATVDLNNIPASLVERIDVVTGGASAVYGSDAVAGVVNFILKDDFEGIQLDVSDELSAAGWDGNTFNAAITMGGSFADGRGNAVLYTSYTNREQLLQGARGFSANTLQDPGAGNAAAGFGFGGSANPPGGWINDPGFANFGLNAGTNTNFAPAFTIDTLDPICGAGNANSCTGVRIDTGGALRAFRFGAAPTGSNDQYNYAPTNFLQLPQERYNITGMASYEISDHIEAYMRGVFSATSSATQLAPTPAGIFLTVNLDNPALVANPTLLSLISGSTANNGNGTATLFIAKRYEEVGPRFDKRETAGFQIITGLRGDLNDQWSYDTFFNFSRSNVSRVQTGNISVAATQAAILCDGGPTAIASGCTAPALNLFGGPGSIAPAAASFISRTGAILSELETLQFVGTISGNLDGLRTPWAETGAALVLGVEYRENFADVVPDSVLGPDVRGFNAALPVGGRYDVYEVFGEAQLPLITGKPLIENLVLNAAYRYSDYSISAVGGVHTFAGGFDWETIPGLRFRAQFQRAVRAPNIGELFSPSVNGFPTTQDPCSGGRNGSFSTATIVSTCVATGVPLASVGANIQPNGQIQGLFPGNPNLTQESADTFTVGMVWQPDQIDGLSLQVDYYNIDIKDAITATPFQTVLNECHQQGIAAQCAKITGNRLASGILGVAPNLTVLQPLNSGGVKASGIDLNIGYNTDFMGGTLSAQYYGSYTLNSSFQPTPGSLVVNCEGTFAGSCGEPTPEYKHTAQFNYLYGALTASVRWRAIASVNAHTSAGTVSTLSDDVGFFNYIDVTTQYAVNEHLDLTVGVRNITGKDVPLLGSTVNEQANTWPGTYTPFGRQLFFGASIRF